MKDSVVYSSWSGLGLPLVSAGVIVLTVSWGGTGGAETGGADRGSGESLQIFAAASLTDTFTEIGETFEVEHGVAVDFNFAGSSNLAAQIEQGAPAAVVAPANDENMQRAQDAEATVAEPELFASNTLVIATPTDNPADIQSLEDMADDEVITVVCAPQVPCGDAAVGVTEAAGVELSPASEESTVTDVLGKVRSGEADAGLMYRTDAQDAGEDVETIEFDGAEEVVNYYPIAEVEGDDDPETAQQFMEFVLGVQGREFLNEAGFTTP